MTYRESNSLLDFDADMKVVNFVLRCTSIIVESMNLTLEKIQPQAMRSEIGTQPKAFLRLLKL